MQNSGLFGLFVEALGLLFFVLLGSRQGSHLSEAAPLFWGRALQVLHRVGYMRGYKEVVVHVFGKSVSKERPGSLQGTYSFGVGFRCSLRKEYSCFIPLGLRMHQWYLLSGSGLKIYGRFQELGAFFLGTCSKSPTISDSILGPLIFGNSHIVE